VARPKTITGEIVQTGLRVPKALWYEVRLKALKSGCSAQDIATRALQEYLNRHRDGK
jgi:hypothetical protein